MIIENESQKTVAAWRQATFGDAETWALAKRVEVEMKEFMEEVDYIQHLDTDRLIGEAADVVITLYSLAEHVGVDLHTAVDRKMAINRERTWIAAPGGVGYHTHEE